MNAPAPPPPPSSGSGVSSDAIMDPLQPAANVGLGDTGKSILSTLQLFIEWMGPQHLGFLYGRWYQHPCADPSLKSAKGPYGSEPEEGGAGGQSKLDAIESMNFGWLDEAAKRLDNLTTSANSLGSTAGSLNTGISNAWSDNVGQSAAGKFNDLKTDAGTLSESTTALAGAMHSLWSTCRQAVAQLSNFATNGDVNAFLFAYGFAPSPVAVMQGTAFDVGVQSAHIDMLNSALQPGGTVMIENFISRPTPPIPILATEPGLSLGSYNGHTQYSNDVCNTLNDFANKYNAVLTNFRSQIDKTYQLIRTQMENLNQLLGNGTINQDPFANLAPPSPTPAGGGVGSVGQAVGAGAGAGGAAGAGASHGVGSYSGGGGGMSGGGGSGATSAASFTPPPISPSTAGAGAGGAGGLPTSGQSTTPTPTPTPGPISGLPTGTTGTSGTSGTTGLPTGTTPQQAQPETVTVRNGSNQISMTSPNGQGTMQVTVDDGSGHPKTYDINFGQGITGASSVPGTHDLGTPATTNVAGHDPSALGTPEVAHPGGMAAPPGPSTPAGDVDPAGAQQIAPGPDGHAVIHDGNLTITATEPAGHHGEVQVTVDDGSGQPTTYTLDPGGSPAGAGTMHPLTHVNPAGTATPAGFDTSHAVAAPSPTSPSGPATPAGFTPPAPATPVQPAAYSDPGLSSTPMAHSGGFIDPSQMAQPVATPSDSTAAASWLTGDSNPLTDAGPSGDLSGFTQSFGGTTAMHSDLGGGVDHSGAEDVGWPTHHDVGGPAGLANTDVTHAGAPGGAGLATGPSDLGGQTGQPAPGGMPMMGGAGGGVGGDIERGASQWRTQGHVFDDQADQITGWISGVLDDSGEQDR